MTTSTDLSSISSWFDLYDRTGMNAWEWADRLYNKRGDVPQEIKELLLRRYPESDFRRGW